MVVPRVYSSYHIAAPRIHFISHSLRDFVRLFLKRQSEIILVVPPPRETPGDFSAKMRAVVDAATPVLDLRWPVGATIQKESYLLKFVHVEKKLATT